MCKNVVLFSFCLERMGILCCRVRFCLLICACFVWISQSHLSYFFCLPVRVYKYFTVLVWISQSHCSLSWYALNMLVKHATPFLHKSMHIVWLLIPWVIIVWFPRDDNELADKHATLLFLFCWRQQKQLHRRKGKGSRL